MKRSTILSVSALLTVLTAIPATAQTSYMAAGLTQFMVDNGAVPYDQPSLQLEIAHKFAFGLSLKGWAALGEEGGREQDLTAEHELGCLTSSVGFFRHAGGGPDDVVQSSMKFGCARETEARKVKPYVGIDRIHVRHQPDYSGWFYRAGLQYEQKRREDLSVIQELSLLHDSGIFGGEDGFIARYELARARKYGGAHGYALTYLGRLSVPLGPTNRDRDVQVVAGLRATH